ncbi:IS3 family transposase [Desulfovibrio sp.]|uniref:IS3 family transposase n=1 Tax=Desulfovibrio sp. TaxID=885 RepID=UPI00341F311B
MLKDEFVHRKSYNSQAEAIADATKYIEIFYNRQRPQAALGYHSPVAFVRSRMMNQSCQLPLTMVPEFDDLPR